MMLPPGGGGGEGGGGGVVDDISADKLRRASVRLTSPTSNGTVCSGFGARKVRER